MNEQNITFRSITAEDLPFLKKVYFSTRLEELKPAGWDDARINEFLEMQFGFQHKSYTENYPAAELLIISLKHNDVGRLYVERRKNEIRIIDIALLPEYRGRGIGSKIMKDILREADGKELPVTIHVEHNNPALSLYARLGFEIIEDKGVYYFMEYKCREA
ncbi:MAG: GNAT family N-acetyltransferase [Victivallaceae bacterium]|nr:GNAT family N-acetyltransferase [Victivallaceae bacterium]